jgi:choline dehydrogenase-like flavoprotein
MTIQLRTPRPWDVIIVGSGATGGWAAYKLARAGLSVLVLEAGPDGVDVAEAPERLASGVKRRADARSGQRHVQSACPAYWELDPDLFVVDTELPYSTPPDSPFQWIRTRSVNGRLLTWGGIGVRLSDHELRAPEQDGFGVRWPIGYADLAPYYDEVDEFLPVYGERDGLPGLPDGRYVGAPMLTGAERRFRQELGEHMPDRPVIASRGVLARPSSRPNGEPGPPSPVREAVRRFGAALRPDAVVSHITVGPDGTATGVAFVDRHTHRTHEVTARSVALCASTLESTRILLNSTSSHHPEGLGNSSGTLGRYLMDHPGLSMNGYLPGDRDTPWGDGTGGPKNVMIPRFHNLENRDDGEFLRGYGIFGGIGRHSSSKGLEDECGPGEVPFTLVAYGEMLPRATNRVVLQHDQRDAWNLPTLRIECTFSENEEAMRRHMAASLEEMVVAGGGRITGDPHRFEPGGFVHEMGTARMGDDPGSSVLNGHSQCWDAPNVYVMDGAAWPSGAWQNPTFSMMAIAGRASEHLAEQLRVGLVATP